MNVTWMDDDKKYVNKKKENDSGPWLVVPTYLYGNHGLRPAFVCASSHLR